MNTPRSKRARAWRFDARQFRDESYIFYSVSEALLVAGLAAALCAVAGSVDDLADSAVLAATAIVLVGIGLLTRQRLAKRSKPNTSEVLYGLAASWLALLTLGTVVYLASGTVSRLDAAVLESAAGFSTTALTTLDPSELSLPMTLWRGATQWIGGLLALVAGVVALPAALHHGRVAPGEWIVNDELARGKDNRTRQVVTIYCSLTLLFALAFAAGQMGIKHSVVHALTTVSTGGFSTAADSFVGFGSVPVGIATVAMVIAGSGYAIIAWAIRGRVKALLQSTELRIYGAILLVTTLWIWWRSDGLTWFEAAFTAASAASTTGFAVTDWTTLGGGVSALLLVVIATGAMIGAPGGGLRINRARILVAYVRRELRRQLDPTTVVLLKSGGRVVDDRALERMTGFQIAHLGVCALAALALTVVGVDLLDAIYTGVSVLSTHGPGLGAGAFGDLSRFSVGPRLVLVPFMFAGHLSLVPLMICIVWIFNTKKLLVDLLRQRQGLRR